MSMSCIVLLDQTRKLMEGLEKYDRNACPGSSFFLLVSFFSSISLYYILTINREIWDFLCVCVRVHADINILWSMHLQSYNTCGCVIKWVFRLGWWHPLFRFQPFVQKKGAETAKETFFLYTFSLWKEIYIPPFTTFRRQS